MDSKINTEEAYLKINSILNNKNKVKFYTPENEEEINNVLIGFKELYHNNENKINIKGIELINKMPQTIEALKNYIMKENYDSPHIPKSKA